VNYPVQAQDFDDFDKEFESFKKEANKEYSDFRDECNARYAKFLAESWKSFKALSPVKSPAEDHTLPEDVLKRLTSKVEMTEEKAAESTDAGINFKAMVVDVRKFFKSRMVEPMVKRREGKRRRAEAERQQQEKLRRARLEQERLLQEKLIQEKKEQEKLLQAKLEEEKLNKEKREQEKQQAKTIAEQKKNEKKNSVSLSKTEPEIADNDIALTENNVKSFTYLGTTMSVDLANLPDKLKLNSIQPQKVADAWTLCSERQYVGLIQDCLDLKDEYKLCDWAYLQMLKAMSDTFFGGDSNESIFLTAYLYCQSGYRIRLGETGGKLLLLYGSQHVIYNQPYFKMGDTYLYALGGGARSLSFINACDKAINEKEQPLSLIISDEPALASATSNKRIVASNKYPEMRMEVSVNENLIRFYNDYPSSELNNDPLTRWAMYANAPLSEEVKLQVYPILKNALDGLSDVEKVRRLLSLIQPRAEWEHPETSLIYGNDNDMWGHDRAFFAEETLYYPYSDCEDHAILFSRMVRDLVGLQVMLVYYPEPCPVHLATAVRFNQPLTGDHQDAIQLANGDIYYICDPTNYIPEPGVTMRGEDNRLAKVMVLED